MPGIGTDHHPGLDEVLNMFPLRSTSHSSFRRDLKRHFSGDALGGKTDKYAWEMAARTVSDESMEFHSEETLARRPRRGETRLHPFSSGIRCLKFRVLPLCVGLLGNYCDPLDCKSYVDPGEAEKIYLCDESHRGEDHNGCDNTYIQPESCQVKDPARNLLWFRPSDGRDATPAPLFAPGSSSGIASLPRLTLFRSCTTRYLSMTTVTEMIALEPRLLESNAEDILGLTLPEQLQRRVSPGKVRALKINHGTCSNLNAGKGKENCVRIEVQSCNRGKPSGEFERKVGIRLSPSTAHVFQKRLQARIDGSDVGNREPGCTPGVPFYENVTWVAVTPPTSVSESTDDDDQLSCEEGEFVIDLPCFCQAAAADVKPSSHTSHPSLYRSHSALVLSVPCHSNGCAESANNCWCLASDGILVPNLIGKPPLPHGVARGSNMCFRQTVDPEDDVYCVFRVPGAPDGSCQGADQSFACNASGGQGPNQTPPPGKDAQRRATKPGLRSLLLRQSHPKRLFLSPAKPGRVYCPNGDVVRSKNYFSSSRHATQQQQQPSKDAVPESKEVVFTKQTTAKNGAIPPLASSTPVKTCGSPRNVMKSNGCCDSPTASVSGVRVKCNSFARSASFGNGHTAECVATEPPKFLEAPKGPSQAYLTSEASSSGSSSQISSLESVRSSGSSSNNGTHQSGVYSTYLNQRAVLNGGSPIQNATEIHIDSKPSPPAVKQCGERPSLCLNHKRNTWIAAVPHGCDSGGEINFDDLAALPFEMPKLQRKLEQMKRHSWNDGDSMLAPSQRYAKSIPTIDEPEHKSSADLEGILSSNRASPGRPQRRSDLHLMLSVGNQELPHIDVDLPLQRQGWFHGAISRKDAEHLLRMTKEGSFLVRNSESSQKGFSLSLKSPRGFMHMRISEQKKGEYVLGEFSKPFTNIPDMVYHYVRNRLPIKGAEHMSLRYPIIEQLL
ncbi:unnamed protein product [Notodromas monacha]|uniref:SH2 domain-containing protein n=1 Tax=Notodromas monacha TaxID=399045 RepID=A0A7R9BC73_9CRUS|nr:unnamed protein product [Notodromas monacha]CAG0912585.1 unnamed protein product [Notodromas monacha]